MNSKQVAAILILYHPDWSLLKQVVEAIAAQCDQLIAIDNSTADNSLLFNQHFASLQNVSYQSLGQNYGIAYAQNKGIQAANQLNSEYVIFFDQDSVPDENLTNQLLQSSRQLEASGHRVGSVGPRATSRATEKQYKAKFATGTKVDSHLTEINQLISSGSLVKLTVFKEVGLFEEDLFIDIVDFEWCWRACFIHGYKHYIVESAHLSHMFGNKEFHVFSYRITVPSSFRIYYQFRNYFILLRRRYVPSYWKISNAFKLSIKFFLFPLICENGSDYLKRSVKGISNGIKYESRQR